MHKYTKRFAFSTILTTCVLDYGVTSASPTNVEVSGQKCVRELGFSPIAFLWKVWQVRLKGNW